MIWNSFKIAFSMYSKIPMMKTEWTKENMKYSMCFLPLIGAVIGGLMILWSFITESLGIGTVLKSAVFVVIPVLITGGIHLDGFLDTVDALNSFQPKEKKLEILKDPHTGAFAIIGAAVYFVLSFGVWSEIYGKATFILAIGFILSRALSGLSIVTFKLAKNTGLAATFSDAAKKDKVKITMFLYIVASFVAMLIIDLELGAVCILAALAVFIYYRKMSIKNFGGITGDLAGFFLQTAEITMAIAVLIASIL